MASSVVKGLTTNDNYSRHRNSVASYQLAQSVLKIGSVLADRVGQGEVGGCTALGDSAWRLLQLAMDGPFFCFLVQTSVENGPFALQELHFWLFRQLSVWRTGQRALTIEHLVVSGCGQGHEPAKTSDRSCGSSFSG